MSDYLAGARTLTLLNPWAHLIAYHGKNVENRAWMPHQGVWRLLIHAGRGWDDAGEEWTRVNGDLDDIQPSAIVAVADLAFACNASRFMSRLRCTCNPRWAMLGQCHWNLVNVRALREPVPAKGRQGLWQPEPPILAAVERQLTTSHDPRADASVGDGGASVSGHPGSRPGGGEAEPAFRAPGAGSASNSTGDGATCCANGAT